MFFPHVPLHFDRNECSSLVRKNKYHTIHNDKLTPDWRCCFFLSIRIKFWDNSIKKTSYIKHIKVAGDRDDIVKTQGTDCITFYPLSLLPRFQIYAVTLDTTVVDTNCNISINNVHVACLGVRKNVNWYNIIWQRIQDTRKDELGLTLSTFIFWGHTSHLQQIKVRYKIIAANEIDMKIDFRRGWIYCVISVSDQLLHRPLCETYYFTKNVHRQD